MYHTGNYLQREHAQPAIPYGSHLGSPRMTHPFEGRRLVDHAVLRPNVTMPADISEDGERDIQRTGSGSLLFFRKRTDKERRLLSQQRAAEMIAQYELSDNKEESLNRKAKFGSAPMPSLGSCLGAQQAAFANMSEKTTVPLGQNKRDEWEQCKIGAPVYKPTRPPLKSHGNTFTFDRHAKPAKKMSKGQQRIEIARATRMRLEAERAARAADNELTHEVGIDVVAAVSPGVYSTATTMAETPSPRPTFPGTKLRATQEIHRLC